MKHTFFFFFLRNLTLFVNYNIYRDLYSYRGDAVPIFTFFVYFYRKDISTFGL